MVNCLATAGVMISSFLRRFKNVKSEDIRPIL